MGSARSPTLIERLVGSNGQSPNDGVNPKRGDGARLGRARELGLAEFHVHEIVLTAEPQLQRGSRAERASARVEGCASDLRLEVRAAVGAGVQLEQRLHQPAGRALLARARPLRIVAAPHEQTRLKRARGRATEAGHSRSGRVQHGPRRAAELLSVERAVIGFGARRVSGRRAALSCFAGGGDR